MAGLIWQMHIESEEEEEGKEPQLQVTQDQTVFNLFKLHQPSTTPIVGVRA
jgi:hypothetical protein